MPGGLFGRARVTHPSPNGETAIMNTAKTARSLAVLAVAALLAACSGKGMTPFTKIDGSDPGVLGNLPARLCSMIAQPPKVRVRNPLRIFQTMPS